MRGEPMVIVNFKVTPEEQELIERHAKKDKMSVSDYVRSCVFLDLVMAGDLKAIRIVGWKLRERLGRRLKALGLVRAEE